MTLPWWLWIAQAFTWYCIALDGYKSVVKRDRSASVFMLVVAVISQLSLFFIYIRLWP